MVTRRYLPKGCIICHDWQGSHLLKEIPLYLPIRAQGSFQGPFQGRAKKFKLGSVTGLFNNPRFSLYLLPSDNIQLTAQMLSRKLKVKRSNYRKEQTLVNFNLREDVVRDFHVSQSLSSDLCTKRNFAGGRIKLVALHTPSFKAALNEALDSCQNRELEVTLQTRELPKVEKWPSWEWRTSNQDHV